MTLPDKFHTIASSKHRRHFVCAYVAWIMFLGGAWVARLVYDVSQHSQMSNDIFPSLLLAMVLAVHPLFTKIMITRDLSENKGTAAMQDVPLLSARAWRLFACLHVMFALLLVWLMMYSGIYQAIYAYFYPWLGGRRNPTGFIFTLMLVVLMFGVYELYKKLRYGAFEPSFETEDQENSFKQLGTVFFPFLFGSFMVTLIATVALSFVRRYW
jgi:hypothetical protein